MSKNSKKNSKYKYFDITCGKYRETCCFHVLRLLFLPLNLVEELYCQNCNTTELYILHEERYSLQAGPPKFFFNVNNVVYL